MHAFAEKLRALQKIAPCERMKRGLEDYFWLVDDYVRWFPRAIRFHEEKGRAFCDH